MEKDFHYHLIYSLVRCTGFDKCEAEVVAHASQFVDDNNEGPFEVEGGKILFPRKLSVNGGNYYPIMTQSLSPKSLDFYIQKYVYLPFHFLPGEGKKKIKGKRNPYSVEPGSPRAQKLLEAALDAGDLYGIGIALHTYVDTWSHQNFTALRENWNSVYPWYNLFKSYVPNIGHAEAGHAPDIISEQWTDHRLDDEKVNNKERAIDAVEAVFARLSDYRGRHSWKEVKEFYQKIVDAKSYDDRIKLSAHFVKERFGEDVPKYDKDLWVREALGTGEEEEDLWVDDVIVERSIKQAQPLESLEETHWYRFQQAAKAQLAKAMELVKGL